MTLPRNKLQRLERVNATKKARGPSLADLINEAASREPKVEILAAPPKTPAPRPEPVKVVPPPSTEAAPEPPAPQTPPPEPPWYEEMCSWRPRGAPDPYHNEVRYMTIHEYDPFAWMDED